MCHQIKIGQLLALINDMRIIDTVYDIAIFWGKKTFLSVRAHIYRKLVGDTYESVCFGRTKQFE